MSVLRTQHSERRVGKGDARHDNFPVFRANFPNFKNDRPTTGNVVLKKANRTVIKYP
jgi:hypothetical protein